ncbi:MAG: polysaccharide deacetylase family protein [Proteobacteria bacterium]|nr:polysaccharide deacetylase family protein [Pseudomonadota bacterium]
MSKFLGSLALAAAMAFTCAAQAGEKSQPREDVAYFQTKNIFHSGLRDTHTIALTFDDGPNANTPAVLDALKQEGVKATFFVVGTMARAYPDVLKRIALEGHLLANHSASHPMLGKKYVRHPELLIAQIREVHDLIAPLMPANAKFYFRAPYGSWRTAHADVLNADPVLKNYVGPIYWDIGGSISTSSDGYVLSAADWDCWHRGWDAETCAKGYMREIRRRDGGVVLMHCIRSKAADLVTAVVPALIEEGYRFVRLDEMPEYKQYETPPATEVPVASNSDAGIATAAR